MAISRQLEHPCDVRREAPDYWSLGPAPEMENYININSAEGGPRRLGKKAGELK
jgi:hypothetical protein